MVTITEDVFGRFKDPISGKKEAVRRFTFANENNMVVQVITLGATITSIKVPDAKGTVDDIVLGFDEIDNYLNRKTNPYFGATVGRVANRIGNGRFFLNGKQIEVSKNFNDTHMLHGGYVGFDSVNWFVTELDHTKNSLKLKHVSPDGHEGFPGEVTTTIRFKLSADNCFHVRFNSTTTKPTPVNLTNHSYFNLAGHAAGIDALFDHSILIKADKITATDEDSIPNGKLLDVQGTPYDFRKISELGQRIRDLDGKGFDNNFCVNLDDSDITMIAKAIHSKSGRWMEVASDQPGVQFYTGNNMPDISKQENPIVGKEGATYARQSAFCFETQAYPDAVNQPNFPQIILKPGDAYEHNVIYKFGAASQ